MYHVLLTILPSHSHWYSCSPRLFNSFPFSLEMKMAEVDQIWNSPWWRAKSWWHGVMGRPSHLVNAAYDFCFCFFTLSALSYRWVAPLRGLFAFPVLWLHLSAGEQWLLLLPEWVFSREAPLVGGDQPSSIQSHGPPLREYVSDHGCPLLTPSHVLGVRWMIAR